MDFFVISFNFHASILILWDTNETELYKQEVNMYKENSEVTKQIYNLIPVKLEA